MKKELGILLLVCIAAVGLSGAVAAQPMGNMHGQNYIHQTNQHNMYGHNMYGHNMYRHHHHYKHYYWRHHHRYWYWAMY